MTSPRYPIRFKLTLGLLLPLVAAILVCSLAGVSIINSRVKTQAQEKVGSDLNAAREIYNNEVAHVRDIVRFSTAVPAVAAALDAGSRSALAQVLTDLQSKEGLDILTAVDRTGRVLFRARNPQVHGDSRISNLPVSRALKGEIVSGTELMPPHILAREGNELADQAAIPVVSTPWARASNKTIERSGLLLMASAPVFDRNGGIAGALYGGVLLNGNNYLVDKIRRIVFETAHEKGEETGAATIFLDDVRICTNVKTAEGNRAVGTQLSEEVYDRVILKGEKWVSRAFVVNDWYFAAYDPIIDVTGRVVGSLYVGMLEKPYLLFKHRVMIIFGSVLLFASLTGLAVSGFMGKRMARPIRDLQNLVQRFTAGERSIEIPAVSNDEIGDLARDFSEMTRTLARREEEIRELNRSLEHKVHERTTELEEKNLLLLQTREELVRAEKLAAVGELAAGVAHEINNPMAIIRGNAELLQYAISDEHAMREELDTIVQQVGRVEKIVSNLLTFARREKKQLTKVQLSPLLDEIVKQANHQASLSGVTVCRIYDPELRQIEADADQLRQVFTNLIVNAIQSLDGSPGTISLTTILHNEDKTCEIVVADTGAGIEPKNLDQIFNPFFTTKVTGTGLGLSVSYGIIKDHGGRIEVNSSPGVGTEFRVILPL